MLILTRGLGESLMIGDNTSVTVLSVRGTQVRLGIDAPKDVTIHREEIYEKIKQKQASDSTTDDESDEPDNIVGFKS